MVNETIITAVEQLIEQLIQEDEKLFLVHIKIKPTNNIKVYLDGDEGLPIEKCVQINRKLYKLIKEKGWFPEGDFSLEVSSPGVDEPLKMDRQYKKNIGRNVEVVLMDGSKKEGKLLEVTAADLLIEVVTGKGKKAVTTQELIPFHNIKTTTVQIQF